MFSVNMKNPHSIMVFRQEVKSKVIRDFALFYPCSARLHKWLIHLFFARARLKMIIMFGNDDED